MSPLTNSDTNAYNQETIETVIAGAISSSSPIDELEFTTHLPAGEIHRRALEARKLQGNTNHLLAQLLLEMEERKLYREFGCSSVYMYAGLHLHLEGHTVSEYLRTGRSLRAFPLLAEAYREGAISACKVREITRVATKETEMYWLEVARTHTYRQIERMVVFSPRRNGSHKREDLHPTRGMVTPPLLIQDKPMPHDLAHHQSVSQAALSEAGDSCATLSSQPAAMAVSSAPALQALLPGFNDGGLQQGPNDPAAGPHHPLQCRAAKGPLPDPSHTESIVCACAGGVTQPPVATRFSEPDAWKYLEKMVIELSAEQAAVIHDALTRARKESGIKDRASLFSYMARVFLDKAQGTSGGISKKPPYQVFIHHHPGSGVTWTESARGPVYMPPTAFDRVLCDAEIVDMAAMSAHEHEKPGLEREKRTMSTQEVSAPVDGDEHPDTPIEQVNRLYQVYRDRGRLMKRDTSTNRDRTGMSPKAGQGERTGKQGRTGTIPSALRKKVLFRDGGRCQVPGCGRSHHVEVHHLMPLGAGGNHVPDGLLVLCSGCHKNVHEGRLSIEGRAPGGLIFRRV